MSCFSFLFLPFDVSFSFLETTSTCMQQQDATACICIVSMYIYHEGRQGQWPGLPRPWELLSAAAHQGLAPAPAPLPYSPACAQPLPCRSRPGPNGPAQPQPIPIPMEVPMVLGLPRCPSAALLLAGAVGQALAARPCPNGPQGAPQLLDPGLHGAAGPCHSLMYINI